MLYIIICIRNSKKKLNYLKNSSVQNICPKEIEPHFHMSLKVWQKTSCFFFLFFLEEEKEEIMIQTKYKNEKAITLYAFTLRKETLNSSQSSFDKHKGPKVIYKKDKKYWFKQSGF